jgi:ABC-type sugar transport system substrate-binding protein
MMKVNAVEGRSWRAARSQLALGSSIVLALTMAGCGGSNDGGGGGSDPAAGGIANKSAYLISCFDANPWCKAFNERFLEQMGQGGVEVTLLQNAFDPVEEAQQFDQAISQKPGAIFVLAADGNAVVPSIKRAVAADIPVVNLTAPVGPEAADDVTLNLIQDSEANGKTLAGLTQDALRKRGLDKANIVILNGVATQYQMINTWDGYEKAMASTPEYKIVENVEAQYDQAKAEELTSQLLAKYESQGGIQVIVTGGDGMSAGAVAAATKLGVPLGGDNGLLVIGGGCFPVGYDNIVAGKEYATLDLTPAPSADLYAEAALKLFEGTIDTKEITHASPVLDQSNIAADGKNCLF